MKSGVESIIPSHNQLIASEVEMEDPVWNELAQYLSPQDLKVLYERKKPVFSRLFSTDLLWEDPLNRLCIINSSIKKKTNGKTHRETFIEGFHDVKAEQEDEIQLLMANHRFLLKNPADPVYLSTLEARHFELTLRSYNIIVPLARQAKAVNSQKLDLGSRFITRLPGSVFFIKDLKAFWSNLKIFDCSFNFIKKIPHAVRVLKTLQEFICHHNRLKVMNGSLFNLLGLEKVDASHNQIAKMPNETYYRSKLTQLDLENNNLINLPTPILKKFSEIQPHKMLTEEGLIPWTNFVNEQDETSLEESLLLTPLR